MEKWNLLRVSVRQVLSGFHTQCSWLLWIFKNDGFFFLTNMQDVNWWTGVILSCFYEPFGLSFWRHPFTAKEPLRKYCYAKFLQICSDEETNSSTFWMAWGWVHFQQIFILGELFPSSVQYTAILSAFSISQKSLCPNYQGRPNLNSTIFKLHFMHRKWIFLVKNCL